MQKLHTHVGDLFNMTDPRLGPTLPSAKTRYDLLDVTRDHFIFLILLDVCVNVVL